MSSYIHSLMGVTYKVTCNKNSLITVTNYIVALRFILVSRLWRPKERKFLVKVLGLQYNHKKKFPLHWTEEQCQRMENVWQSVGPTCQMRSDKITLLLETSFLVFCSFRSPAGWGKNFLSHSAQRNCGWEKEKKGERKQVQTHCQLQFSC